VVKRVLWQWLRTAEVISQCPGMALVETELADTWWQNRWGTSFEDALAPRRRLPIARRTNRPHHLGRQPPLSNKNYEPIAQKERSRKVSGELGWSFSGCWSTIVVCFVPTKGLLHIPPSASRAQWSSAKHFEYEITHEKLCLRHIGIQFCILLNVASEFTVVVR
jgi:hypothetical protein